jgi:HSP20 family protein
MKNTKNETGKNCPACYDVYEENGQVILSMEMPGVSKDNLNVKVDNDMLIVHGKKSITHPEGEYLIREIRDSDYYHEFSIDETIDREKIEAAIKNGIVQITLGLKEAVKPRKIEVVSR